MNKIRIVILIAVLAITGVIMTVSGVSDIIKINGTMPDFNFESIADIKKGDMVAGYIANIYDCYAGETTTNTTMGIETSSYTSREYFIMPLINDEDWENEMFVSVSVSKEADRELMYDICDATYEYLDGNEDVEFPEMAFIAKAQPLDPELLGYMLDWFDEAEYFEGGRDEAKTHIVMYDLVLFDTNSAYISLAIGLILIAAAAAIVFFVLHNSRKQKQNGDVPYADPNGYPQDIPAYGETPSAAENTAPAQENGFSETNYAPSANSYMNISQPVQPDDFFAKPAKKSAPETQEKPKEPEPSKPANIDSSGEINTDSLDTDRILREQEAASAAAYRPVNAAEGIDTGSLDTDKALYEQEQASAAAYKPVDVGEGIDTDSLNAEKTLYEQEQASAAAYRPVQTSEEIDTASLNAEKVLYEQEQASAAAYKPVQTSEEIDTSSLDMGGLGYFDDKSLETEDEDIFDFTNDLDYDVADASDIKIE